MCLYARDLRISEGQQIQRILRRSTSWFKVRRAQVVLASNQGYKVPAISELVHYSEHPYILIHKHFMNCNIRFSTCYKATGDSY